MTTILVIACVIGFILIIRWLGSWMLRIDVVINKLNEIIIELKKANDH